MDSGGWKVFLTVAECGSVSAASRRLNLSQSGVSYTLSTLEKRCGFPLFHRHRRGVTLTESGRALLPIAQDMLNQQELLGQEVSRIAGLTRGSVRVGSFSSAAATWLPSVLAGFMRDYPRIEVEIREGASEEIEAQLAGDEIDFAVTSYRKRPHVEWIDLARDRLVAVAGEQEGAAALGDGAYDLARLEHDAYIASTNYYEHDVSEVLERLGIRPANVACRSRDERTIASLARQGMGVALFFESTLAAGLGHGLTAVPTKPAVERRLGIAVRSLEGTTPAAKALAGRIVSSRRGEGARAT